MTDGLAPLPERWYCVSRDGLATLCRDEDDARMLAAQCDTDYPRQAPHRPVLMGDVAAARDACANAAWTHYLDVCKARRLAPSEHEHWNAARTVREDERQSLPRQ